MKLNHIRNVIAVAKFGSLRSAARHLGLAQPAITRSIRELEHELGVRLFERRATGVVLTLAGQKFLRRAASIQNEIHRIKDEIEQLKNTGTGHVAVGLSTASHLAFLPKTLKPFRKRFPEVQLKLSEGLFPAMEANLQDGSLDFYVGPLADDFEPSELVVEHLFSNRRIVIARAGHPLTHATSLNDLVDAQWIATSVTYTSDMELAPLFTQYGLPKPKIAAQASTALSMVIAAAYSDLLAMLPQQWSPVIEAAPNIQQLQVHEPLTAADMCLVYRARLPLTPAAEHLADLIRRAALQYIPHTDNTDGPERDKDTKNTSDKDM